MKNRFCPCIRCKMNDSMGPAVLVTLGVMLLLEHLVRGVSMATVVAVLLIVIGGVKLLQGSASTEGHRQPGTIPEGSIPPVPPAPPADVNQNNTPNEVHHG
ncbi:MAG TPA: hypothetical protein VM056_04865 [Terriglobales bacterium]|nr:hypothetical protein [Terriglobales bacterium]